MQNKSTPVVDMLVLAQGDDEKLAPQLGSRKKEFTGPILLFDVNRHLFLKVSAPQTGWRALLKSWSVCAAEMRDTP